MLGAGKEVNRQLTDSPLSEAKSKRRLENFCLKDLVRAPCRGYEGGFAALLRSASRSVSQECHQVLGEDYGLLDIRDVRGVVDDDQPGVG